jgi:hypothetical protein
MAESSDRIIKQEIIDVLGSEYNGFKLRVFPEGSNDDQRLFANGGLTFGFNGIPYGSCDAAWYLDKDWLDGYAKNKINCFPIIGLEGTDALNRKSSGNAQYQRFHHALGAVKNGLIGIYYLRPGSDKMQEDLYGMAYNASKKEDGYYLVIQDLNIIKDILNLYNDKKELVKYLNEYLDKTYKIFLEKFNKIYKGDWNIFAEKRSTIIKDDYIIKYAGRMKRNFTDGSQRAGHIAVGEMYLTKYYFYDKKFYYLFLKTTRDDVEYLDKHKSDDKEWFLLRHEPNVEIKTIDDIEGLEKDIKDKLIKIKDEPIKGSAGKIYNQCVKLIASGLKNGKYSINQNE